jgi:type I restriction enzyme S subunit
MAITGQGKTRGKVAVLGIEATINQHVAYITLHTPRITTDFLHLHLQAAYSHLRRISDDSGSTKGALTCEDIKHFRVAVPPLEEQARIAHTVKLEVCELAAATERVEREIELIREYRTRLISDVVTGKLDVRGVEIPEIEGALEWNGEGDENDSEEEEGTVEEEESGADD